MNATVFSAKMNNVLADNAGRRRLGGQRSGQWLDSQRLAMIPTGDRNIFSVAHARRWKKYAITILSDMSGSMRNEERDFPCADAIFKTANALDPICNLRVYGFNVNLHPLNFKNIDMDSFSKNYHDACYNDPGKNYDVNTHGNHDGYQVRICTQELLHDPAPGKILMVFSDGRPHCDFNISTRYKCEGAECGSDRELSDNLRRSVTFALSNRVVLLSIGIQTNAVFDFYPRKTTRMLSNTDLIYTTCADLLSENVERG